MRLQYLLLSLFILAARLPQPSSADFTHVYAGDIGDAVTTIVVGDKSIQLNGDKSDIVDVSDFIVEGWAEVDGYMEQTNVTLSLLFTNALDMVIQSEVTSTIDYPVISISTYGTSVADSFTSETNIPIDRVIHYSNGKILPIHMISPRSMANSYKHRYPQEGEVFAGRTYESAMYGKSISLRASEELFANSESLFNISATTTVEGTRPVEVKLQLIIDEEWTDTYVGSLHGTMRQEGFGGPYYTDLSYYDEDSGLANVQAGSAYDYTESATINKLLELVANTAPYDDQVVWSKEITSASDYSVITGNPAFDAGSEWYSRSSGEHIVADGVRMELFDRIRITIPDGIVEDNVAYKMVVGQLDTLADDELYPEDSTYPILRGGMNSRFRGGKGPSHYYGIGKTTGNYFDFISSEWIDDTPARPCLARWVAIVKPDSRRRLFLDQDTYPSSYTRNPECIIAGFNTTPFSPWNSGLQTDRGGALLSPRHFMYMNHWKIPVGNTVRFVSMDNRVSERILVSTTQLGDTDIMIGVLDSDLTEEEDGISFCKVMPRDMQEWLPAGITGAPVAWLDKVDNVAICQAGAKTSLDPSSFASAVQNSTWYGRPDHMDHLWGVKVPSFDDGLSLSEGLAQMTDEYGRPSDRDSGNPFFIFVQGETQPVLLGAFTSSTGMTGSFPINHDAINQIMAESGGEYQLDTLDLSQYGYSKYKEME